MMRKLTLVDSGACGCLCLDNGKNECENCGRALPAKSSDVLMSHVTDNPTKYYLLDETDPENPVVCRGSKTGAWVQIFPRHPEGQPETDAQRATKIVRETCCKDKS